MVSQTSHGALSVVCELENTSGHDNILYINPKLLKSIYSVCEILLNVKFLSQAKMRLCSNAVVCSWILLDITQYKDESAYLTLFPLI